MVLCCCICVFILFFFFKQKTAYEMRISDWSSDVCSSDLCPCGFPVHQPQGVRSWPAVWVAPASLQRDTCGNCPRWTAAHDSRSAEFPCPPAHMPEARSRLRGLPVLRHRRLVYIGRASCRESVGQYVLLSVGAASLKKKK